MAKNFGSAASAKTFDAVAKASAEKAQVVVVKMISNDCLLDYPKNHEDVLDTADLENSIKELGFTDPIEVTDFGMEDGKYMIVSGHRRRTAGVKSGMTMFPCIVRHFGNEGEVNNYVLLANSQRDSAKDPLLFCKRYKMHEEYLKEQGFEGKIRDEVAKRLGISVPQADRYNAMNKVIAVVWDMVRDEIVGMSSIVPMASHTPDEQAEIYDILQEAIGKGVTLTRDTVKLIIDSYRDGKRSWAEIADLPRDSGIPLNATMNTEPSESRDPVEYDRNDEVNREYDPIADELDGMDADREAWENEQDEEHKGKKPPLSEEEKQKKRGKDIMKNLGLLSACLNDIYTIEEKDEAEETMKNMVSTFMLVVDELYHIAGEHDLNSLFLDYLGDLNKKVTEYID